MLVGHSRSNRRFPIVRPRKNDKFGFRFGRSGLELRLHKTDLGFGLQIKFLSMAGFRSVLLQPGAILRVKWVNSPYMG